LLQHRRRQRSERGGVGRGVQFCVNLRRAAVVDRRAGAEHQHRSDQRIHHRDIAAAIAQQPIKMKCRQRHCPQLTKLATLMRPRATGENFHHQTTSKFMSL
jgi:hypothetical protein